MDKNQFLQKFGDRTPQQQERIDKIFLKKTASVEDISIIMSWSRYNTTKIVKDIKEKSSSTLKLSKTTITLSQFLDIYNELT